MATVKPVDKGKLPPGAKEAEQSKNFVKKGFFTKVTEKAAKEYGSKNAGRRVVGTTLANLRAGQYRGR